MTVNVSESRTILICSEEVSQKSLNKIRGIENHERVDEELYQDYEDDDTRKVIPLSKILHSSYCYIFEHQGMRNCAQQRQIFIQNFYIKLVFEFQLDEPVEMKWYPKRPVIMWSCHVTLLYLSTRSRVIHSFVKSLYMHTYIVSSTFSLKYLFRILL